MILDIIRSGNRTYRFEIEIFEIFPIFLEVNVQFQSRFQILWNMNMPSDFRKYRKLKKFKNLFIFFEIF